jgi:hypothetical protein
MRELAQTCASSREARWEARYERAAIFVPSVWGLAVEALVV